ncbi:YqhR family membrane protein [Salibacterium aidingense]|uniref:YqhR family membrane protein n=1 Tax=Salibacterium aidingense TaxID=384933 RepID=UPI003BCA85F1
MKRIWLYNQKVAGIGFFGGLIWSCVGYAAFSLNFTKWGPAMAVLPWALPEWKETYLGHLTGIVMIALLSILAAYLYRVLFQKWESIWLGAGFGIFLWVVVFYFLHPIFPGKEPISSMSRTDLTTTLCLYLVYGVFIGYSISYEYKEMQRQEE